MPTYSEYLKIDELLELQRPLSDGPEHDEMLFIVIHQVYELWFKQVIHELDHLERLLARGEAHRARHTLGRVLNILKVMVGQLDILETMTPLEFLSFRDRLASGSGFQSYQFRELEAILGNKNPKALERYPAGSSARTRIEKRLAAPTIWDAFLHHLAAAGLEIPKADLTRDVTKRIEPSEGVRKALIAVYHTKPDLADLCERFVDLDEGVMEWRYRHVKMVQRTIGTKMGTGGSAGAEYLKTTLDQPLFQDLWTIRSEF